MGNSTFVNFKVNRKYNKYLTIPTVLAVDKCEFATDALAQADYISSLSFNYTKLLLHMNGADASTTFIDETGKAVTAVNQAQIDTAQKKFGTGSCLLDGTGDYLSLVNSADFNFGAGDFTVDCWIRFNSTANPQVIAGRNGSSDRSWVLYYNANNLRFGGYWNSTTNDQAFAWTPGTGTWYHIAVVRSTTSLKLYVNGAQIGSTYNISTYTIRDSSSVFYIGENVQDTGYGFNGWIDEFRISKGIARWTADFSGSLPSVEYKATLIAYSESTIKTEGSYSVKIIADNYLTSLNQTLTRTLGIDLKGYDYLKYDIYASRTESNFKQGFIFNSTDNYTKILMHMDGEDSGTTFTDECGRTVTRGGNPVTKTATKKLGTASAYFDGTGDLLSFPNHSDLDISGGNFDIDCWINFTTLATFQGICSKHTAAGTDGWCMAINTLGKFYIGAKISGVWTPYWLTSSKVMVINTWYHIRWSRVGNNFYLFQDGVLVGQTFNAGAIDNTTGVLALGSTASTAESILTGYIDEFRFRRGIGVSEEFTVPSEAYTYSIATVTKENTPNILVADTWQTESIDLSAMADTDKQLSSLVTTILNADALNTFYIDNIRGEMKTYSTV